VRTGGAAAMAVVGEARRPGDAAAAASVSPARGRAGDDDADAPARGATPDGRGNNTAALVVRAADTAGSSRRPKTALSLPPDCQSRTAHTDNSVSASVNQAQPSTHVPDKQGKASAWTEARLARAGRKTTFISKPPRPVPLGTREAASYQVRSA
jgi:hypothetical protein